MVENQARIAVVIPVYNAEKTLKRCLDSIAKQDYKDFDAILVNDGSTDSSLNICKSYAEQDKRFKVFDQQNGGASSARNYGLNQVATKFVTFCDADDYVETNWLSTFMSSIDDFDAVISSFTYHHETTGTKQSVYRYDIHNTSLGIGLLAMAGEVGMLWNKCFRMDIIKKQDIHFNEEYTLHEDEEFVTHYMMFAKAICFKKELTYNYFVPASWNAKYSDANIFDCKMDIYNHMKKFIPQESFFEQSYSSVLGRLLDGLIVYYEKKQYDVALRNLLKICDILNTMPGIQFTLNRRSRFLIRRHPSLTHKIYKFLARIHKLRGA